MATPAKANRSLHHLHAHDVAKMIRDRDVTSVDLTRIMLARIAAIDPAVRSYAFVSADLALEQARAADRDLAAGRIRGPLHGVPVAVKDLCDTAGIPTAAGFGFLADRRPARDATVVRRIAESGAVLLGKLRTTEGAFAVYADGKEAPRNAWNEAYWTGHSSSGSAVATATGLAYATLGTDTGGSIRYPASANGIVGLKPTWGRVSRAGIVPFAPSLDHVGPMTRSVRDAALLLVIIAGRDEADATSSGRPVPDFTAPLRATNSIAIDRGALGLVDGPVRDALQGVEAHFQKLGFRLVDTTFPSSQDVTDAWNVVCASEGFISHKDRRAQHGPSYSATLSAFLDAGAKRDAADISQATLTRLWLADAIDACLTEADAVLLPVQRWAPPSLRDMAARRGDKEFVPGLLMFTAPTDLSGHPTLVLPSTATSHGVPIGFQLVGRRFDEARLIAIGEAFEASVGGFAIPA